MGSSANAVGTSQPSAGSGNWVTIRKMALIIELSYPTTRKLVVTGKIRSVKVGGQYRIYEEEVKRFLREGNAS